MFAYSLNYLIDLANAIIVDVEATPMRLRLRGLSGAHNEFSLTAAVQNLKRLATHATRPPPQPMTA